MTFAPETSGRARRNVFDVAAPAAAAVDSPRGGGAVSGSIFDARDPKKRDRSTWDSRAWRLGRFSKASGWVRAFAAALVMAALVGLSSGLLAGRDQDRASGTGDQGVGAPPPARATKLERGAAAHRAHPDFPGLRSRVARHRASWRTPPGRASAARPQAIRRHARAAPPHAIKPPSVIPPPPPGQRVVPAPAGPQPRQQRLPAPVPAGAPPEFL